MHIDRTHCAQERWCAPQGFPKITNEINPQINQHNPLIDNNSAKLDINHLYKKRYHNYKGDHTMHANVAEEACISSSS